METRKKWRVVLGNRDGIFMDRLKRSIERKGDLQVVAMTDDGRKLVELAEETKADVVLLDTILGSRDGFWALERIKYRHPECVCIMITSTDNDNLVRKAIGFGADYYMAKPIQGELLVERIYQMMDCEPIRGEISRGEREEETMEIQENFYRNLECEISTFLNRMGISASIKGYHFIRKAILITVRDEEALIGITKGLYPDIAKTYRTTPNKVERAIRHAIESAWKKNGMEVYSEVVGFMAEGKPTNGQFIGAMTQYFRLRKGVSHQQIG